MKDSPTSSIRNKPVRLILALGALTLLLAALSLAVGAVHVPLGCQPFSAAETAR